MSSVAIHGETAFEGAIEQGLLVAGGYEKRKPLLRALEQSASFGRNSYA